LLLKYDAVFDASGKINKTQAKRHVKQNGAFTSVAGQGVAKERKEDIHYLNKLFEAGRFRAVTTISVHLMKSSKRTVMSTPGENSVTSSF